MATIRKHRNKWQAQVRLQGRPPVSRTFVTHADAERWARETEVAMERGEIQGDPGLLRKTTLGMLLTRYRDEVSPRKASAATERYRINRILKQPIARFSMGSLSREAVAAFRDERLAEASSETARQYLVLVRQVIEVARREWGLPLAVNPVDGITRPKGAKARTRRLAPEEWDRLKLALSRLRRSTMSDAIQFALATGMRRGEIIRARWADIDWSARTLRIEITKNGEPRTIPLTPAAIGILNSAKQGSSGEGAIFQVTANGVKLAWRRVCAKANVPDLRFHDLRHEAVSRYFELGLSVPEVAMISGHKDVRMLMRYTHLRPADLAIKLSRLSDVPDQVSTPRIEVRADGGDRKT